MQVTGTLTGRPSRLAGAVGVALLTLTLALSACGGTPEPGNTAPPTTPPSTTATSPSTTPGQEADMRTRLIEGLRDASPSRVRLLQRPETSITEVRTPWLTDWQVVDVLARIVPHPVRFFAAISTDGQVVQLTGLPAEFSTVTRQAKLDVSSAKVAVAVAEVYLDSTQDFSKASYRISSVDDIQWLKTMTTAEQKKKVELERDLPKLVGPPEAKASGDGWVVTTWMVYDRRLDKHTVTIGPDGAVSDQIAHEYEGLPVPESI